MINKLLNLTYRALCLALFCTVVQANSIGINFSAGTLNLGPTDQPGIVAGANWNNISGGSGTSVALNDATGASTTALLSFTSTGAFGGFNGTNTANTATNLLYQAGLVGNPNTSEVSIDISNIPYARYDVYVFSAADTTDTNTISITDGLTTFYQRSNGSLNNTATNLLQTTSIDPVNPTVGPGQYQVFHKTGSSVSLLTGGSINDIISNNVFGLQIVQTVPEPGTFSLIGLGLIGMRIYKHRNISSTLSV